MPFHAFHLYLTGTGLSDNTARQYVKQVRRWISWMTETGAKDPRAYLEYGKARWSPSAQALALYALRHWYTFEKMDDPLPGVRIPKKPPRRPHDAFTREELNVLYTTCESAFDKAMFLLLLNGGLRASEAVHLTEQDVDVWERRAVIYGKGERYRNVPLSDRTIAALQAYWRTGDDTWSKLTYPKLWHWFRDLGLKAHVQEARLHRLRTSAADVWIESGIGIDLVQELMGHRDIATTMHYTRRGRHKRAMEAGWRYAPTDILSA